MKRVNSTGSMPKFISSFLTQFQPGEDVGTEVYDCSYDEVINKAQSEKLEPQVLIDKKETGRAFLCAIGASVRKDESTGNVSAPPIFYFAELDDDRKRVFMDELRKARQKVIEDKKKKEAFETAVKESTREAASEIRSDKGENR